MPFDKAAMTWDLDLSKVKRAQLMAKIISEYYLEKKLGHALEFGCGTGLVSFYLKDYFRSIDLADVSEGMISVLKEKIAKEMLVNFHPILLKSNELLEAEKYDAVYSLMALHHIPDLDGIFYHFKRILKNSGYLFVADLVKENGDFHTAEIAKSVHHGFDKEQLLERLNQCGFSYIDYQLFIEIEKVTESGNKKKFPLFLLVMKNG